MKGQPSSNSYLIGGLAELFGNVEVNRQSVTVPSSALLLLLLSGCGVERRLLLWWWCLIGVF